MKYSNFQSFVRCNVALAFLPLVHLESTLEELQNWEFDKGSENFDEMVKFRDVFMEYTTHQWVEGSFPPRVWNCWKKLQNTNNIEEGYNSKINKMLNVFHPNPNELLVVISQLLNMAEVSLTWLEACLLYTSDAADE